MKLNKSIFIVVCVLIGSHFSFTAEQPEVQKTYLQYLKDWFYNKATQTQEAIAPTAQKVAVSSELTKSVFGIQPSRPSKITSGLAVSSVGGLVALQGVKNTWHAIQTGEISSALAGGALLTAGLALEVGPIVKALGKFDIVSSRQDVAAIFLAIGLGATAAGLFSVVYHNVMAPVKSGDIQEDKVVDKALKDMTRDMIQAIISDDAAYPTRSSKIHALLKRNEFLNGDDTDVVVEEACSELIASLTRSYKKRDEKEKPKQDKKEKEIEYYLDIIREEIRELPTPEQQINYLINNGIKSFQPHERAVVSLLLRLRNKLAIDVKRKALGLDIVLEPQGFKKKSEIDSGDDSESESKE